MERKNSASRFAFSFNGRMEGKMLPIPVVFLRNWDISSYRLLKKLSQRLGKVQCIRVDDCSDGQHRRSLSFNMGNYIKTIVYWWIIEMGSEIFWRQFWRLWKDRNWMVEYQKAGLQQVLFPYKKDTETSWKSCWKILILRIDRLLHRFLAPVW